MQHAAITGLAPGAPACWKSTNTLRTMFEELGIAPGKQIAPLCASGDAVVGDAVQPAPDGYQDGRPVHRLLFDWEENPDPSRTVDMSELKRSGNPR